MDSHGYRYPFIPYDLILDTEIGLYKLIRDKYRNEDFFATGILDASDAHIKYFLLNRREINPLETIAYDDTLKGKELCAEYYKQFMERELDYILRNSSTTTLYNFVTMFSQDKDIHIKIWCPNNTVENFLRLSAPSIFGKVEFVVSKDIYSCIKDSDNPIYAKDIKQVALHHKYYAAKNVYLANYNFNYEFNEVTGKKELEKNSSIILEKTLDLITYEPYNDTDLAIIKD